MSQHDPVTPFAQNLSAWLRTASLSDLVTLLETVGAELLVQRGAGPVEQAGVDALRAANRLRPLTSVTVTNLAGQPNCVVIGSHGAAREFLDHAAAKYPVTPPPALTARSCNRHDNCDKADAKAREAGRPRPDHCHDECCEDCFGY